jgi:hypothetical protein
VAAPTKEGLSIDSMMADGIELTLPPNENSLLSPSFHPIDILLSEHNTPQHPRKKPKIIHPTNIHNYSMKLGGSLGDVPPKLKKLVIKTQYISDCWSIFRSKIYTEYA